MSASSAPTTQMLWLSCPTEEAIAPRFRPKPCTKPRPMLRMRAVPLHHRDLDGVLAEIDMPLAAPVGQRQRQPLA